MNEMHRVRELEKQIAPLLSPYLENTSAHPAILKILAENLVKYRVEAFTGKPEEFTANSLADACLPAAITLLKVFLHFVSEDISNRFQIRH